ncbi:MAG: agmatinase [Thermoproteota archaeon]
MGIADLYLSKSHQNFGDVESSPESSVAVVFGVPFDHTVTYRPGSRFAPASIRQAAANIEFYSLYTRLDLERYGIADLGDVAVVGNPRDMVERLSLVVREVLARYRGRLLVVLGGEHTITVGLARGLAKFADNPCILAFDAHMDLRDEYLGERYSHAATLRRIADSLGAERIFLAGARAFTSSEYDYAKKSGMEYVTVDAMWRVGINEVVSRASRWAATTGCDAIHVTIDMDVFDPGFAPGVSNPEPLGLEPRFFFEAFHRIIRSLSAPFISIDVVEVSPPYDCGEITSVLAAKVALEAIAAWLVNSGLNE